MAFSSVSKVMENIPQQTYTVLTLSYSAIYILTSDLTQIYVASPMHLIML
jgi:hypothetical protein